MIPKIDLSQWKEPTVPKKEVEEMTKALSDAFAMILQQKEKEYQFAKAISYLSLIVATLLIAKEVFF